MCSRHHPLCVHACMRVCVWLLVETYFRQNASIDGSQVNGILAIVIHTVNYLTERRVIFQIVCATAGYLPRVSVRHECFSWNGSFIWENRNSNIGPVCSWHWNWGQVRRAVFHFYLEQIRSQAYRCFSASALFKLFPAKYPTRHHLWYWLISVNYAHSCEAG